MIIIYYIYMHISSGRIDIFTSKAQQKAVHKYVKTHYDRINVTMQKGRREVIQTHAAAQGESVNAFINRAIMEAMERDKASRAPQEGKA